MSSLPPGCARAFTVEKLLATGGFGKVYLARQTALGRPCAVKVLDPAHLADAEAVERFRQEALLTGKLQHPNVVIAIDHGVEPEGAWIAYEYLPGRTLETVLRAGELSVADAVRALADLLAALDAAHGCGVLHRDIKPENLIESEQGAWKLADFGIARFAADQPVKTRTGVVLGTVEYLPPERIAGEEPGPASDLYAAGIVLFRCLTGDFPFAASDVPGILRWHSSGPVPRARDYRPEVPPALDDVLKRALARDPRDRFPSARAMADALAAAARPPRARSGAVPRAASRATVVPTAPRKPRWAVLALATAAGVALWTLTRPPIPAPTPSPASVAPSLDIAALRRDHAAAREPIWRRDQEREAMKRSLETGGDAAPAAALVPLAGARGLATRFTREEVTALIQQDERDLQAVERIARPLDDALAAGPTDLRTSLAAISLGAESFVAFQTIEYLQHVLTASADPATRDHLLATPQIADKIPYGTRGVAMLERSLTGAGRAATALARQETSPSAPSAELTQALRDFEKLVEWRQRFVRFPPDAEARLAAIDRRLTRELASAGLAGTLIENIRSVAIAGRNSARGRVSLAQAREAARALALAAPANAPALRALDLGR